MACANLDRNLGNPPLYLDCMQFMLAPFPQNGDPLKDGDPTRGANVLNNSWGWPAAGRLRRGRAQTRRRGAARRRDLCGGFHRQ